MKRLLPYFSEGVRSTTAKTVGAEIETMFIDKRNRPITVRTSQAMLKRLAETGWKVVVSKGVLITELADDKGNRVLYELGRHNIEVATAASEGRGVLSSVGSCLGQLYRAGEALGAMPLFEPVLNTRADVLVIPDSRDATWLELDGREALTPLARISSVQFTVSVSRRDAVSILNRLGNAINWFLIDYPQEKIWRRYIASSLAGYLPDRYGGPLRFDDLDDYCRALARHDVVQGTSLVPLSAVTSLNIPLFIRSVWWHFRLRRYGDALCIEIRPMARRSDRCIVGQYRSVIDIF